MNLAGGFWYGSLRFRAPSIKKPSGGVMADVSGGKMLSAEAVPLLAVQSGTVAGGAAEEKLLMLRHEAEAWRLVQALWERIEGEDGEGAEGQQDEEDFDMQGGGEGGGCVRGFRSASTAIAEGSFWLVAWGDRRMVGRAVRARAVKVSAGVLV